MIMIVTYVPQKYYFELVGFLLGISILLLTNYLCVNSQYDVHKKLS
jgi:hypothetical protein